MKRNTTRRAFSRLAAVLLAFGVAAASAAPGADGRIYLNPNTPHYKNARYGFSLTLPGGQWEVKEAANGDGFTAKDDESDPKSREVRAWGTNSPQPAARVWLKPSQP